jgi:hypothetical protein
VALLADARPSHHLPVPSLVQRAAPSGVVPGELGGAAVLGASSGVAEGAHHRSGTGGTASAIAHRHSHARIVPHPSRANASRPRHTHRSARCGRIGSGDACPGPLSCGAECGGWGWAGWAWPEGLGPTGADAWSAAGPAQIGGQVAGCWGPREPARSAAVDPGPGGRLAMTELLARVAGRSVSLNCPCADQGGRHVDMVVGADHRGRAGVGVWRDAASSRLTARRQRPDHGRHTYIAKRGGSTPNGVDRVGGSQGPRNVPRRGKTAPAKKPGVRTSCVGVDVGVAGADWAGSTWREICLVRVWAGSRCRTWDRCGAAVDVAGWPP